MNKLIIIVFILSYLYAPNQDIESEKELNDYHFEKLWDSILMVESNKMHYRNGKIVVSHKGAIGIAQVMPNTFDFIIRNSKSFHLNKNDIYIKQVNEWSGKWYFHYLYYDIYPNSWKRAVSGYNGGYNNTDFMEDYVKKVIKNL